MEGDRVVHQVGQSLAVPSDGRKSSRSYRIAGDGQHLAVYVDGRPVYADDVAWR